MNIKKTSFGALAFLGVPCRHPDAKEGDRATASICLGLGQ